MENIKRYESSIIKRACYMVNACEINEETMSKGFYFTEGKSFIEWYNENNCENSWILSSFYEVCMWYPKAKAINDDIKRAYIIPACETLNKMIDLINKEFDERLSRERLLEMATEEYINQGTSRSLAWELAENSINDPKFRKEVEDGIIEKLRKEYEPKLESGLNDIRVNAKRLWSDSKKRYRHVEPYEIEYTGFESESVEYDGGPNAEPKTFSEYQYLLALEEIYASFVIKTRCIWIDRAIELAQAADLGPDENNNGLPGANWDMLETVVCNKDIELEDDIVDIIEYCLDNGGQRITESWIFKYLPLTPSTRTEEEKEAETMLNDIAKSRYVNLYLRTMIAFAKAVQASTLYMWGDNTQSKMSVAAVMKQLGIETYDFYGNSDKEFITALIALIDKLDVDVDAAGMTDYIPECDTTNVSSGNTSTTASNAGGTQKSKWVAFVLCLLLGHFGAHKFYEGKYGMGLLYLFTFGLAYIGVIVDLFAIWKKTDPYYVE